MEAMKTVSVRITGKVQGVYYRKWTAENATRLGLSGWVRNRRDGSVEALFSGKAPDLDAMLQSCRIGPEAAAVASVTVKPLDDADDLQRYHLPAQGFEIRPTE